MAQIMTPAVQEEIRVFCKAFAGHRMLQPPEFTSHWRHFRDMYEQSYGGIAFATERPWFAALIAHGTAEDFAALVAVNDGRCDFRDAMIRCIIQNILEEAWGADQVGKTVSTALPAWFRGIGARVPEDDLWNCMRPAEETGAEAPPDAEPASDLVAVDFAAVD